MVYQIKEDTVYMDAVVDTSGTMAGYCRLDKQKCSIMRKNGDWAILIAAAQANIKDKMGEYNQK